MSNGEEQAPPPARSALFLDVQRYQAMLDSPELSDAERAAFIEALWGIVVGFVDLGFQIHPLQQGQPACGQLSPSSGELATALADMLSSQPIKSEQADSRSMPQQGPDEENP
jgi:hypothetical protein